MIPPSRLVQEARGLIGMPWLHQGRGPVGVDCIGFVFLTFKRAGIDITDVLGLKDRVDYARDPDPALVRLVENYCTRVETPSPGSLLLFRFRGESHPRHFAIYTADKTIVHACARRKEVVEHGYRGHWVRWTDSIWHMPHVSYDGAEN